MKKITLFLLLLFSLISFSFAYNYQCYLVGSASCQLDPGGDPPLSELELCPSVWYIQVSQCVDNWYILEENCPTGSIFTGVSVWYNNTSYQTTKNIMLQNTTFDKYEDSEFVYFNAKPNNIINFNNIPVDYTGSTFLLSGSDFQIYQSGWVLIIEDIPIGTGSEFTGYYFTWPALSFSWSTFTWNAFELYYNQVLGLVLDNMDLVIWIWFWFLFVVVLFRVLFPKRRF